MSKSIKNKSFFVTTLVHSLLYPAVLGAMFYNFLPVLFLPGEIIDNKLFFISTILVIAYFCIDYVYTISFPNYSLLAGVFDTLALILVYRVEVLLNPLNPSEFTRTPAILLMVIHALFIGWDIKGKAWEMLPLNFLVFLLLAICAMVFPNLLFFIAIQIVMLIAFSIILRRRLKQA
jgi:hypothetical protein